MSALRKHCHDRNFTILDNPLLDDERLSLRARGLLALLLSKPDDYPVNATDLAKRAKEGRDAIEATIRELIEVGYVRRRREQDAKGHWITVTDVYETPVTDDAADNGFSGIGEESTDNGFSGIGQTPSSDGISAGRPDTWKPEAGQPGAKDQGLGDKDDYQGQQHAQASQAPPARDDEPVVIQIKPRRGRSRLQVEEHPQARELCDLLADLIAERVGERPRYNGKWLDAARLLLTKDGAKGKGYAYEDLVDLVYWTQGHDFWQGNILSMPKLREKRFTLISQYKRDRGRTRRETPHERARRESIEELERLAAAEEAELRAAGGMQ